MQKNLKIAKSFDPCQPARTSQADMNRYFSQMHETPFYKAWHICVMQYARLQRDVQAPIRKAPPGWLSGGGCRTHDLVFVSSIPG